jgi:hypothetical protein
VHFRTRNQGAAIAAVAFFVLLSIGIQPAAAARTDTRLAAR